MSRYVVNRMAALREAEGAAEPNVLFDLRKSFGACAARKRHAEAEFEAKITDLKKAIALDAPGDVDNTIAELASQSGLSMYLLLRLRKRNLRRRRKAALDDRGLAYLDDRLADG